MELVNAVARLQKELEEFRAESGYGSVRRSAIPDQTSGGSGFMSTSVPMCSKYGFCIGVSEGIVDLRLIIMLLVGMSWADVLSC